MAPRKSKQHPKASVIDLTKDNDDDRKPAALPKRDLEDVSDEERPRKRAAKLKVDEDFEGPICLSDEIQDVTNQTYSLEACGHTFCFVCLEGQVQASMPTRDTSTAKPVPCPLGCSCSLTMKDIQTILQYSPKTLSLFNEASSMAFLEERVAQGTARRCPSKNCNYTFEYEPGKLEMH
jgi:RING-type zinc-finger